MTPFNAQADTGDLVAARKDISATFSEEFTNTPSVRQGTRGLVRKRTGNQLTVAFDTSYGLTETTIHTRDCRLIQHNADEKRFMDWAQLKTAVRIGALITLATPIAWYIVMYWAQTGSLDGVIEALTLAALESTLELPGLILTHPTQTLIFLGISALTARIALGPRPRRKHHRK